MSKVTMLLLVEDSADDRELTVIGLRDAGISNPIEIARDGQEALEYLSEPTRPLPALVLLDLKLPRISGLDVLARLREQERTSLLPVVVLTSSNEESDRLRSYGAGANAYVCKPVEFGEFAQAIKALGLFWLVVNQPPPAIQATDAASSS
jgi:two-component system, response regulator